MSNCTKYGRDLMIVMGDLNAKVDSDHTLFKHVPVDHDISGHSNNNEKFVDFCIEHGAGHKVNCVSAKWQ